MLTFQTSQSICDTHIRLNYSMFQPNVISFAECFASPHEARPHLIEEGRTLSTAETRGVPLEVRGDS